MLQAFRQEVSIRPDEIQAIFGSDKVGLSRAE